MEHSPIWSLSGFQNINCVLKRLVTSSYPLNNDPKPLNDIDLVHVNSVSHGYYDGWCQSFLVHLSNNPGLMLVSHPLLVTITVLGRRQWIWLFLAIKNLVLLMVQLLNLPWVYANHDVWHRNDNIVASWLQNSLSKEMYVSVLHFSFAKAIWEDLKECFEQQNGPLIFFCWNVI